MSLLDLKFPDGTFNIIWSEGSVQFIGFENPLVQWRHLLKSGGFLVIYDALKDKETNLGLAGKLGYRILQHFDLPPEAWWDEYYPLLQPWSIN